MSEPGPESMADKPPVPPREELVATAAKFLSSPSVLSSPREMKVAFLKKKGLSDAEIELAMKRSEALLQSRVGDGGGGYLPPPVLPPHYRPPAPRHSWSHRLLSLRDLLNTVFLLAGALYGLYWFYKRYVWKWLFRGGEEGRRSTEDRLADIEAGITGIGKGLESLKEGVDSRGLLAPEISALKAELASLKKMLLNRAQFPAAGSGGGALSIPSWQMAAAASAAAVAAEEKEEEGAATNGSDSSLEMIKE